MGGLKFSGLNVFFFYWGGGGGRVWQRAKIAYFKLNSNFLFDLQSEL